MSSSRHPLFHDPLRLRPAQVQRLLQAAYGEEYGKTGHQLAGHTAIAPADWAIPPSTRPAVFHVGCLLFLGNHLRYQSSAIFIPKAELRDPQKILHQLSIPKASSL